MHKNHQKAPQPEGAGVVSLFLWLVGCLSPSVSNNQKKLLSFLGPSSLVGKPSTKKGLLLTDRLPGLRGKIDQNLWQTQGWRPF